MNLANVDGKRYTYPKQRDAKQWARDVSAHRMDAAVALDAVLSGDTLHASELQVSWLVRLAIEDYRLHAPGDKPSRIRAPWIFRERQWVKHFHSRTERGGVGRGDVFCLFCCEPQIRNTRQWDALGVIDYGPQTVGHTTLCALSHLAGQRAFATWGAVKWPDDMLPEVSP